MFVDSLSFSGHAAQVKVGGKCAQKRLRGEVNAAAVAATKEGRDTDELSKWKMIMKQTSMCNIQKRMQTNGREEDA